MVRPSYAPHTDATEGVRVEACAPTEVYAHRQAWPAETEDARAHAARGRRRRTRARGIVSLMWAVVVAVAAVQHAGEVERRAHSREPSAAELAMQERPARQIRAAWHDIANREVVEPLPPRAEQRPIMALTGASDDMSQQQVTHSEAKANPAVATEPDPLPRSEPDTPQISASPEALAEQKSDTTPGDAISSVTATGDAAAAETARPKAQAAAVARAAAEPPRGSKSNEPSPNPADKGEPMHNTAPARVSPTATRAESPVDAPARTRSRTRHRASISSSEVKTAFYLAPGDFVPEVYFTTKGLNRYTP